MNVLKKIGFFLMVLIFAAGAAYGYFYLKSIKKPSLDAFSLVPDSCIVYLRTNSFFEVSRRINSQSIIADKMRAFHEVDELCRTLRKADSIFSADEQLQKELADAPVHVALYGDKVVSWLVSFNIRKSGDEPEILRAMEKNLLAVRDGGLYRTGSLTRIPCFFSVASGVVAISDSRQLLADYFNSATPKLRKNPGFISRQSTFGESNLLSLYIDHRLYARSAANRSLRLSDLTGRGCSASAIDTDPSSFTINGLLDAGSFAFLAHQDPQPGNGFTEFLPANTTSFKAWGAGDLPRLLEGRASRDKLKEYWESRNEIALYNAEKDFYENAANYLIAFSAGEHRSVALRIKDTARCDEHLRILADTSLAVLPGVCRLSSSGSVTRLFAPLEPAATSYAVRAGEWLYFSEDEHALSELVAYLGEGQTLRSNVSFQAYQNDHFTDDFNLLVYNSPARDARQMQSVFKFRQDRDQDPYADLRHFSFCLRNDGGDLRFRVHLLNEARSGQEDEGALWTFVADTSVTRPPALFINHHTRERELICQDDGNTLYLLNAKGNRLWRKNLPEKIVSEIHMVDAFKNNKFQMLFNTRTHLYLVDRNGNNVEGFPVKLPAPASAPLSLFDYENNRDYRIILPCGNTIYNFDVNGALQTGFSAVKCGNPVYLPVQYAKAGANDFLVTIDSEGSIVIFSRRGEPRIGLKNRALAGCRSFYVDAGSSVQSTQVVYFDDKSSILHKISFTDKKSIAKLDAEFEDASAVYTTIDENRLMDVLISSGGTVGAYNLSGTRLFEKTFAAEIDAAGFFSDESQSVLYGLSAAQKTLFVFDQQSQKTRILRATALPAVLNLFRDNKKYLLVGNGKKISCVKLGQ